jgi:hypothetical protein
LTVKHENGYLILAVNTPDVEYTSMAKQLCQSIKDQHPHAKVCLLTDVESNFSEFDFVELLPYGNQGGFNNDWQVWAATPFRETIKLEADMLVTSKIDHWWTMFRHRDVVISTGARDFYDNVSSSRYYRKIFDSNNLPDVYNAITYWRRSSTAQFFWKTVREIFSHWEQYKTLIKFAPAQPDTDLVYAIAAVLVGVESVTLPATVSYPKIVHMKQHVIPTHSKNWTEELVWEKTNQSLRINTVSQWGCLHYHVKNWTLNEQQ